MIHSIRFFGALGILVGVTALTAAGCGSGTASDGSGSEIASSAMSGAASSSEGTVASLQGGKEQKALFASMLDRILSPAYAAGCGSVLTAATCSVATITIPDGGCTTGFGSGVWTGNQIITYTTGSCAANAAAVGNSAANAVFTRTTDTTGITRTGNNGPKVTLTTLDSSGYSTPLSGGAQITCGTSGCATSRTIKVLGQHYVGASGFTWDHTVSTDADISVTGSGATRVINSGTIRVQHNLAKFVTVSTISGPLTHTANCCFPISGSVTTAFSGGKLDGKSETVAYSATCGAATLTDSKGGSQPLTLTHCM